MSDAEMSRKLRPNFTRWIAKRLRGTRRAAVSVAIIYCLLLSNTSAAPGTSRNNKPIQPAKAKVQPAAITKAVVTIPAKPTELLYTMPSVSVAPAPAAPSKSNVMLMEVTAYCPCSKCCGPTAHGYTASGKPVTYGAGHFCAADVDRLPFGTKVIVPGYNQSRAIEVVDRGSAIKGSRIDVFFPTHAQASKWGRRWLNITVVQ